MPDIGNSETRRRHQSSVGTEGDPIVAVDLLCGDNDIAACNIDQGESSIRITHDKAHAIGAEEELATGCLLYTSPSPRDRQKSRMPSSA